jgi:hypothetical protein
LLWAGVCDFVVATAFAAAFVVGARAYSFFGAESLAEMAARGSAVPRLMSGGLAVAGVIAGIYAIDTARRGARLPSARIVLALTVAAFLIRGAWLAIELGRAIPDYTTVRLRELLLSVAAVSIGILHLVGLRDLTAPTSKTAL